MTFLLTGTDIDAKADLVRRQLAAVTESVRDVDVRLETTTRDDPATNAEAVARLTITVKDADADKVGRAFSNACVELALASYPGATVSAPPGDATPYGVYWPTLVPNELVQQVAVLPDGSHVDVKATVGFDPAGARTVRAHAVNPGGPTRRVPLGAVFGARSGDKGGTANVGVWARDEPGFGWLVSELTVERFRELLPETAALAVDRYVFPNLRALNFVVAGAARGRCVEQHPPRPAGERASASGSARGTWNCRSRCSEASRDGVRRPVRDAGAGGAARDGA